MESLLGYWLFGRKLGIVRSSIMLPILMRGELVVNQVQKGQKRHHQMNPKAKVVLRNFF